MHFKLTPIILSIYFVEVGIAAGKPGTEPPKIVMPSNATSEEISTLSTPLRSPQNIQNQLIAKFDNAKYAVNAVVSGISYGFAENRDKTRTPIMYVSFRNAEFLKGKYSESDFVLMFAQGPVSEKSQEYMMTEGVPWFSKGDEVLLFLNKNGYEVNPVEDTALYVIYKGLVYTTESQPIIKSGDLFAIGMNETIEEILVRDFEFNGFQLRIESSGTPDQDETGYAKVSKSDLIEYLKKNGKPSDSTFTSSKINYLSHTSYTGEPTRPNQ